MRRARWVIWKARYRPRWLVWAPGHGVTPHTSHAAAVEYVTEQLAKEARRA